MIPKVIDGLSKNPNDNSKIEDQVRKEVVSLCSSFPIRCSFIDLYYIKWVKGFQYVLLFFEHG